MYKNNFYKLQLTRKKPVYNLLMFVTLIAPQDFLLMNHLLVHFDSSMDYSFKAFYLVVIVPFIVALFCLTK